MSRPREPLRTWEVSEVPCLIPLIFSLTSKGIIDAFPTQTHKYASPLPLNIAEGHFKPHLPVSAFPKGCTVRATFQHPTSICELTATMLGLSLGVSCGTTSEQVSLFTRKYLAARPIHLNLAQIVSSFYNFLAFLSSVKSSKWFKTELGWEGHMWKHPVQERRAGDTATRPLLDLLPPELSFCQLFKQPHGPQDRVPCKRQSQPANIIHMVRIRHMPRKDF